MLLIFFLNQLGKTAAETVETIVCQLMEKQRLSRQAALVKQLDCGCGDAACADGKTCSHPVMRRSGLLKANCDKKIPTTNINSNIGESFEMTSSVNSHNVNNVLANAKVIFVVRIIPI